MHGEEEAPIPTARPRLRWWLEVLIIAVFYVVYTGVRNQFGSAQVSPRLAFDNARRVIAFERLVGLYHERAIQGWFLGVDWFIRIWNIYYGSVHFIVTAAALIVAYHWRPWRYSVIRNTLAATTALALIGFASFPLMPPRLLDDSGPYGGAGLHPSSHPGSYGFTDTLARVGGLWSFDSGTMQSISNQYAAMPSLHIAWSCWVAFVLWPLARHRWQLWCLAAYPLLTLFCIIVTANHFWVDGAGGLVTLATGYGVARAIERARGRRSERSDSALVGAQG